MKKTFLTTLLLLFILCSAASAFASEIDQERIDLFLSSQNMLAEAKAPPRMKVGMVLSTIGNSEVSFGVRIESRISTQHNLSVITETIHLKQDQTLAGFLSLKYAPFTKERFDMYLGAGAGYADGFRFQAFAGIDFTKNFYAEARYINHPGGLGDKGIYLATGFQFTY